MSTSPPDSAPQAPARLTSGLSAKLLLLTVLFVMLAEVLIYVPSVANFRINWLNDRLSAARTAALALEAAPANMVPESLAKMLLDSVGARTVATKSGDVRRLLAVGDMPIEVHAVVDMRDTGAWGRIMAAIEALLAPNGRVLRVVGEAPMKAEFVEIVLDETPLKAAMLGFSRNILLLSLLISAITASLVYLTLIRVLVRPMRRLTRRMVAFRDNPEDASRIICPSDRADEIGVAERELAFMQRDIASMLHQRSRLAQLGLAVSKINHDLRNMLSSAQLFTDRIASAPDPTVQRLAPKLVAAVERAIQFCEATLSYGKAQEQPPERREVALGRLAEDVRDTLGLSEESAIRWVMAIERGMKVDADPDQLFRVLLNLGRNSVQALEARAPNDPERDQIRIIGRREGAVAVIEISDTGPGIPARAREKLFEAFSGSVRAGGTGLGLAISAEIVRAHGGALQCLDGTLGATFRIDLPDRPIALEARREARRSH